MLVVVAALAAALVPVSAGWVERAYSGGAYLAWQRMATSLSNVFPFALFDILVSGVAIGLIACWALTLYRAGARWLRALGRLAWLTVILAATLYLWFALSWGFNYRRAALSDRLAFTTARVTPGALVALADRAIAQANTFYASGRDPDWPLSGAQARLGHGFARAQRQLRLSALAVPGRPKRTVFSLYFRYAAIDGMTDPFFLETLINPDVLAVERPMVVAHEWAHLAGYADEGDANFVAWLTCLASDGAAQYSAWLYLAWQASGELRPGDRSRVTAKIGPGPRADIAAIRTRLARAAPIIQSAAREVYDSYLRAHDVEGGITSYGRIIELILGTRFNPDGSPVLR